MTSEKQGEANRRNAMKSTGPRTPEGKEAVRLNALKHGLLSRQVVLPEEDEEALRELSEHLRTELKPVGALENLLLDRIVSAYWRLSRLGRVEVGIFVSQRFEVLAEHAQREADDYLFRPGDTLFEGMRVKKENIEKYEDALERARQMRSEQGDETATLGRTFARDADKANAFSKLIRYETTIDRTIHRALHELQRLQAARRADGGVAPPGVIDVDVFGVSGDET
jgi:hypothetical protein